MIAPGEATVGDRYPGTTHPTKFPTPLGVEPSPHSLCSAAYGVSDTLME